MDDQSSNNQNKQAAGDQPIPPQPAQTQPVVEPVSTGAKEQAPAISTAKASEYVVLSEASVEIPQEVKEAGVEDISEKAPIADQHTGINPSGSFVQPKTEPEGKVELPLTQEEVIEVEKKENNSSSIRWLAAVIRKAWKRIKGGER
jgi:hypothetical protein